MADQMYVIITLRKPVADAPEGRQLYDRVKEKLKDVPNIELSGLVTNHFTEEIEP
jgi:hypothetical protein